MYEGGHPSYMNNLFSFLPVMDFGFALVIVEKSTPTKSKKYQDENAGQVFSDVVELN